MRFSLASRRRRRQVSGPSSPAQRAAGAQAQLGLDADTSGGSALPIRSFPADNFFYPACCIMQQAGLENPGLRQVALMAPAGRGSDLVKTRT